MTKFIEIASFHQIICHLIISNHLAWLQTHLFKWLLWRNNTKSFYIQHVHHSHVVSLQTKTQEEKKRGRFKQRLIVYHCVVFIFYVTNTFSSKCSHYSHLKPEGIWYSIIRNKRKTVKTHASATGLLHLTILDNRFIFFLVLFSAQHESNQYDDNDDTTGRASSSSWRCRVTEAEWV